MPAATSSHKSSGLATPPGNRHPIPTIAIGSPATATAGTTAGTATTPPSTSPARKNPASATGVG